MTALEAQQRGLLDLLKRRGPLPEDPYLRLVSESPALAVVRATALFWRGYQLRSQCQFTASLLRRLACFDACVTDYFCHNGTSPYTDRAKPGFPALPAQRPPSARAVGGRVRAGSTRAKVGIRTQV